MHNAHSKTNSTDDVDVRLSEGIELHLRSNIHFTGLTKFSTAMPMELMNTWSFFIDQESLSPHFLPKKNQTCFEKSIVSLQSKRKTMIWWHINATILHHLFSKIGCLEWIWCGVKFCGVDWTLKAIMSCYYNQPVHLPTMFQRTAIRN